MILRGRVFMNFIRCLHHRSRRVEELRSLEAEVEKVRKMRDEFEGASAE